MPSGGYESVSKQEASESTNDAPVVVDRGTARLAVAVSALSAAVSIIAIGGIVLSVKSN